MTTLNPVTSVSQNGYDAPIGAESDNIFLYDSEHNYLGTLSDFYANWLNFKRNNNFVFTGSVDPENIEQIKVWYQTYDFFEPVEEPQEEEGNN